MDGGMHGSGWSALSAAASAAARAGFWLVLVAGAVVGVVGI